MRALTAPNLCSLSVLIALTVGCGKTDASDPSGNGQGGAGGTLDGGTGGAGDGGTGGAISGGSGGSNNGTGGKGTGGDAAGGTGGEATGGTGGTAAGGTGGMGTGGTGGAISCDDGVQNQDETEIDCGGPNCDACCTLTVESQQVVHGGGYTYGHFEAAPVSDGFLAVWRDATSHRVLLRKLDITGAPQGSELVVNENTLNAKSQGPQIAFNSSLNEGIVVWSLKGAGSATLGPIRLRRVAPDGTAVATAVDVNVSFGGVDDGGAPFKSSTNDAMIDVVPYGTGYAIALAARGQDLKTSQAVIIVVDQFGAVVDESVVSLNPEDFVDSVSLSVGTRGLSLTYAATNSGEQSSAGVRFLKLDSGAAPLGYPVILDGTFQGTNHVETATSYLVASSTGTSKVLLADGTPSGDMSYASGRFPVFAQAGGVTLAAYDDGTGALGLGVVDPTTAAVSHESIGLDAISGLPSLTGNGNTFLAMWFDGTQLVARVATAGDTCSDTTSWDSDATFFNPPPGSDFTSTSCAGASDISCCDLVTSEVRVTTTGDSDETAENPQVVYNPTLDEYAVVWSHRQSDSAAALSSFHQVRLARFDPAGNLIDSHLLYDDQVAHGNHIEPQIVATSTGYFVLFVGFTKSGYLTYWDTYTVEVTIDPSVTIGTPTMSGPRTAHRTQVAWDGNARLASYFSANQKWIASLSASAVMTSNGEAMSPSNNNSMHQSVAALLGGASAMGVYNIDGYAVPDTLPGLYVQALTNAGSLTGSAQLAQAGAAGQWYPSLVSDGAAGFVLAYTYRDPADLTTQIFVNRVTSAGVPSAPKRLSDVWGPSGRVQLAPLGTSTLAVWQQAPALDAYTVYLQRFSAADTIPAQAVAITDGTADAITPDVAASSDEIVVAFSDARGTAPDVYLQVLTCE